MSDSENQEVQPHVSYSVMLLSHFMKTGTNGKHFTRSFLNDISSHESTQMNFSSGVIVTGLK